MTLVFRCSAITTMIWLKVRAGKFSGRLAYISDFMEAITAELPSPLEAVLFTIAIKVRNLSARMLGKKENVKRKVGLFQTHYVQALSMLNI